MHKIVFTGPESSGKTTLCKSMANKLKLPFVSEYAREYLNRLNRPYEEKDLLTIAKGQVHQETIVANTNRKFLLCDTSLLVIKIWSHVKYGKCHPWIEQELANTQPAIYFLCSPDIPWVADPLREHPTQRKKLLEMYIKELKFQGSPYIFLTGSEEQRENEVMKILSIYS